MTDYLNNYGNLELRSGSGGGWENGLCVMEAAAWLGGETATDKPECACPVLGRFAISLNDKLNDKNRQQLLPLALDMVGSRSKEHEQLRADLLVMEVGTKIVPQAFDAIGLHDHANALGACKTKEELRTAAYAAASAAYAANAFNAAYAAAYAAASAAYAANAFNAAYAAANAANYAANAVAYAGDNAADAAKQKIFLQCVPILSAAIKLGPNGHDSLNEYMPRIKELGKFANTVLAGAA